MIAWTRCEEGEEPERGDRAVANASLLVALRCREGALMVRLEVADGSPMGVSAAEILVLRVLDVVPVERLCRSFLILAEDQKGSEDMAIRLAWFGFSSKEDRGLLDLAFKMEAGA